MSIVNNLIGEDGLKFDTNVELGKDTLLNLFGVIVGAIIVGILVQSMARVLIKS